MQEALRLIELLPSLVGAWLETASFLKVHSFSFIFSRSYWNMRPPYSIVWHAA